MCAEIEERIATFALRVAKMAETLPKTVTGRTIAGQVVRSAFSAAANYRAAGRGRSKAEFIAKSGIAEEEADETWFWLEMAIRADLVSAEKLSLLTQEAAEIVAIITSSRISAKRG